MHFDLECGASYYFSQTDATSDISAEDNSRVLSQMNGAVDVSIGSFDGRFELWQYE